MAFKSSQTKLSVNYDTSYKKCGVDFINVSSHIAGLFLTIDFILVPRLSLLFAKKDLGNKVALTWLDTTSLHELRAYVLDNEQFPRCFFLALFKTIPMCKVCCLKTSLPLLTVHFNANQACFHFSGRTPGLTLRQEANQKWSMFYLISISYLSPIIHVFFGSIAWLMKGKRICNICYFLLKTLACKRYFFTITGQST